MIAKFISAFVILFVCFNLEEIEAQGGSALIWTCSEGKCLRRFKSQLGDGEIGQSLEICKLTCYEGGNLWPKPTGDVILSKATAGFFPRNLYLRSNSPIPPTIEPMYQEAQKIFRGYMNMMHPNYIEGGSDPWAGASDPVYDQNILIITLAINSDENQLKIGGNESYTLAIDSNINAIDVRLNSETYFGFRHGLETLNKIYSELDMIDLVTYGRIRGVKVYPELDAPSHAGHGWTWGPEMGLGNLVVCVDKDPWNEICLQPTCGELNPVNNNTYNILGQVYNDMLDVFDNDLFHMGGDEVLFKCWNTTDEIVAHLQGQNKELTEENYVELWAEFQERAYQKLTDANGGDPMQAVLWTSTLTSGDYLDKYLDKEKYIVHYWESTENPQFKNLIEKGFRIIMSNFDTVYLDCGFGGWVGWGPNNWCSPYKGWQQIYMNDIVKMAASQVGEELAQEAFTQGLFLGGETALWSEQTDDASVESKIFPRASAYAERLWSNPETDWEAAETRILSQRRRLVERGVFADGVQPEWCYQNDGGCHKPRIDEVETTTPVDETTTPNHGVTSYAQNINIIFFSITAVFSTIYMKYLY